MMLISIGVLVIFFIAFIVLIAILPPREEDPMITYEELMRETKKRIEKEGHLKLIKKEDDGQTNSKTDS